MHKRNTGFSLLTLRRHKSKEKTKDLKNNKLFPALDTDVYNIRNKLHMTTIYRYNSCCFV